MAAAETSKPTLEERARPPEALAETVYNFAFGSNLNPEKRSSRGVNGTGIVTRAAYPAVVHGFRLAFNLPMFPPVCVEHASILAHVRTHRCSHASQQARAQM